MTDPLLSEPVPPEVAERTVRAAEELAAELGATPEQVRAHVEGLPPRYLAAVSPRTVVRHTLLTASPPGAGEVRTRVTAHDEPGAEPERAAGWTTHRAPGRVTSPAQRHRTRCLPTCSTSWRWTGPAGSHASPG
jgi:hypothetical protein